MKRIFPKCGEGFRRISIVVAIATSLLVFTKLERTDTDDIASRHKVCYDDFARHYEDCTSSGKMDRQACYEMASKKSSDCIASINNRTWSDILGYWGLFAIGGLICAYLAALGVRTIGWVALGFSAVASK
jgi:hypothetical protein